MGQDPTPLIVSGSSYEMHHRDVLSSFSVKKSVKHYASDLCASFDLVRNQEKISYPPPVSTEEFFRILVRTKVLRLDY